MRRIRTVAAGTGVAFTRHIQVFDPGNPNGAVFDLRTNGVGAFGPAQLLGMVRGPAIVR